MQIFLTFFLSFVLGGFFIRCSYLLTFFVSFLPCCCVWTCGVGGLPRRVRPLRADGSPPRVSPFSYIGVLPARLGLNAGVAYAARSGLFTSGGVPIWLLIGWSINTHLCVNL